VLFNGNLAIKLFLIFKITSFLQKHPIAWQPQISS